MRPLLDPEAEESLWTGAKVLFWIAFGVFSWVGGVLLIWNWWRF